MNWDALKRQVEEGAKKIARSQQIKEVKANLASNSPTFFKDAGRNLIKGDHYYAAGLRGRKNKTEESTGNYDLAFCRYDDALKYGAQLEVVDKRMYKLISAASKHDPLVAKGIMEAWARRKKNYQINRARNNYKK